MKLAENTENVTFSKLFLALCSLNESLLTIYRTNIPANTPRNHPKDELTRGALHW